MTKEEDDYLNFLSMKTKVVWEKEIIAFPIENGDQNAMFVNQRLSRIKLKDLRIFDKLSFFIKNGLSFVKSCNILF